MPKKKFYAIVIYEEGSYAPGQVKEYCLTREIAERELKKYRDFFCSDPPKPDERHIRELEMTVE